MISVIIFDKGADAWNCDTWLMSCRVLGRRVEEAVLNHAVLAALAEGATRLRGTFIPTAKNRLVERHFANLGFAEIEQTLEGGTVWELDLRAYVASALPITII